MQINSLNNITPKQRTNFGYNLKLSSDRQEFLDYCIQERKEKFYFNDRDEHQRYIKALNYFNGKTINETKKCDYYADRIKLYDEEYYNKWLKFCKDLTTPEEEAPKKEKKSIFSIFKRKKAEKLEMPDMSSLDVDVKGCYYGWESNEAKVAFNIGKRSYYMETKCKWAPDNYLHFEAFKDADGIYSLSDKIEDAVDKYISEVGDDYLDMAKYRAEKREHEAYMASIADEINGINIQG